jgi:hypothetical protein
MGYRVMQDGRVMDEKKRSFDLVDHCLDSHTATALAKTAVVIEGNFPKSEEITGNPKRIDAALGSISTEWTLFSYIASHYSGHGVDILFLDYCH